ncbi:hypothetical protein DFS34DRAFT_649435 [Phlyctochytrium arcticum]|nr:hypothetical protein DFS34DRAFT_649435 [Phlyctochytrium arcticum]
MESNSYQALPRVRPAVSLSLGTCCSTHSTCAAILVLVESAVAELQLVSARSPLTVSALCAIIICILAVGVRLGASRRRRCKDEAEWEERTSVPKHAPRSKAFTPLAREKALLMGAGGVSKPSATPKRKQSQPEPLLPQSSRNGHQAKPSTTTSSHTSTTSTPTRPTSRFTKTLFTRHSTSSMAPFPSTPPPPSPSPLYDIDIDKTMTALRKANASSLGLSTLSDTASSFSRESGMAAADVLSVSALLSGEAEDVIVKHVHTASNPVTPTITSRFSNTTPISAAKQLASYALTPAKSILNALRTPLRPRSASSPSGQRPGQFLDEDAPFGPCYTLPSVQDTAATPSSRRECTEIPIPKLQDSDDEESEDTRDDIFRDGARLGQWPSPHSKFQTRLIESESDDWDLPTSIPANKARSKQSPADVTAIPVRHIDQFLMRRLEDDEDFT